MSFRESFSWYWSGFVQWVKDHTTAQAFVDGVKTALWVVPLTILIWVFAEQAQDTQGNEQVVLIKIRSADPDRVVSVLNPHDLNPIITMKGPRAAVEQVKRELDQQGESGRLITVDVPSSLEPGFPRDVDITSAIENAHIFKNNGIVVSEVRPVSIQVRIDPLESHDLPVVAPADANLDGPATFEPKTIKIRVPKTVFDEANTKAHNTLAAIAQIPLTGELATPGTHEDAKLPVKLPADLESDNVTPVSSLNVVANYKIKTSSVPGEIKSLLIRTSYASNLADELQVELPSPVLGHVQISGPKEKVEKVISNADLNNDPKPYATLPIDSTKDIEDFIKGTKTSVTLTRTLDYNLGDPDVIATDRSRTIDVVIRKRASAPGQ